MKILKKKWDLYFLIAAILLIITNIDYITKLFIFNVEFYEASSTSHIHTDHKKKYKVGYLVGFDFLGDIEEAKRGCLTSQKLGWDCYVFYYSVSSGLSPFFSKYLQAIVSILNHYFKPDFLIHAIPSYYPIAPTNIPNYVLMPYDILKIFSHPGLYYINSSLMWANAGNYDGYLSYNHTDWAKKIDLKSIKINNTPSKLKTFITYTYPTSFSMKFTPLKYEKLFYCGNNWDALRSSNHYKSILINLAKKDLISIFGSESSWQFIKEVYKGEVHGMELIKKIQEAGISLVLHSNIHLEAGIPTHRIFEAAAASTLIISDHHSFVKKEFGNCVLYIDPSQPVEVVVNQLEEYVNWAKENPKAALLKAKCAHEIFAKKFTMEKDLLKIAKMHEEVLKEKHKTN